MTVRKMCFLAGIGVTSVSSLNGQTAVGADVPDSLGFTQAEPSFPLSNPSEFDFSDLEGQVALVVYHASW